MDGIRGVRKHSRWGKAGEGAAVLLCCLFCLFFFPGQDTYAAEKTVRAGYFNNGDFMHKEADGSYAGYDIEYYYTLAGYADWNLQFVEYGSLKDALAALQRGDIDVLSGLSETPERTAQFLRSDVKMCTTKIAVQTRAEDDRFAAGSPATMENMVCGILKASNVAALYSVWCAGNGLTPHVMYYSSLDERNAAFENGEIDAVAAGSTIAGAQKIAEFPGLDLYFMFNRDKMEQKKDLDLAMSKLSLQDSSYAQQLFEKYFPLSRNASPAFSAAEKAYIREHPRLRVAVLQNDAPFSSIDKENIHGIIPQYFEHLSARIGTEFVCVPYPTREDAAAALDRGEVDLIGKTENNIFGAERAHLLLTNPYFDMSIVQIVKPGRNLIRTAAVPVCNQEMVEEILQGSDAAEQVIAYENNKDAFDALRKGKVDSVICPQPAAAWMLTGSRTSDYLLLSFGHSTEISCALPYGDNGNLLRSVFNKTIAADTGYMDQLVTTDTLESAADVRNIIYRLDTSVIIGIAAVFAVLLALVTAALVILIRRRSMEKKLAVQKAELAAEGEANRARHDFFGAVSHDMRTPLNGIIGFTNLALVSRDEGQIRDYLDKIRSSGTILRSLVNDMLVMSRVEGGKYVLKPAPIDLCDVFSDILEPVRQLAADRHLKFEEDASSLKHAVVEGDSLSLQKIVLNLLTNAVKFTPPGGRVSLHCGLSAAGEGSVKLIIQVRDTGCGISREFLPHVFEPYAQENGSSMDTSGSGMGLSIVKSIVDAMGGTIKAESEVGKGSCFTAELVLPEAGAVSAALPAQAVRQDAEDAGILRKKRALICEDNALNMEIERTILEQQGMEVIGAPDGKTGLGLFMTSPAGYYDVVLLDLRMPVMGGREAALAIRALDRNDAASVPLLAVSANAYPEDVRECLDAGMNGHIAKPIDADILVKTIAREIRRRAERSAAVQH